jgi:hypothetical protein
MAKATDSNHRNSYARLSYAEKSKYLRQGYVYHPNMRINKTGQKIPFPDDTWQIEWSSGIRQSNGRLKYYKITLRGTKQQARSLLDIIIQVPHRTYADAYSVIEPFIEWRRIPRSGSTARYVKEPIPSVPTAYQLHSRERIIRDYHRIKLLDTIAKLCRELGNYECEGDGVGVDTTNLRT